MTRPPRTPADPGAEGAYTAYSYLAAGDFRRFELAPEFGRVAPYAVGLTAEQERRSRRLLTDSTTGQGVRRIAWFPDGERLALGQHPGRVGIWSLKTAGMKTAFGGHEKVIYAVAVSPDGNAVISAAADGAVMVWTVPEMKP